MARKLCSSHSPTQGCWRTVLLILALGVLQVLSEDCPLAEEPRFLGSYYSKTNAPGATEVVLSEVHPGLAYCAWGSEGLAFFNISNVRQPIPLSTLYLPGPGRAVSVSRDESILAVTDGRIVILYDITDFMHPAILGHFMSSGTIYDIALSSQGTTVFVADSRGLQIVDLRDRRHPILMGSLLRPASSRTMVYLEQEKKIYISSGTLIDFISIEDLSQPKITLSYDTQYLISSFTTDNTGSFMYLAVGSTGMMVLDIRKQDSPLLQGTFATKGLATYVSLSLDQRKAYLVDVYNGIWVLDVSNPQNPSFLNLYYTTAQPTFAVAHKKDPDVIIIGASQSFQLLNISSSEFLPAREKGFQTNGAVSDFKVDEEESLIFIASPTPGLQAVNLNNMKLLSIFNFSGPDRTVGRVELSRNGNLAFLLADGRVYIVKVDELPEMKLIATYQISEGDIIDIIPSALSEILWVATSNRIEKVSFQDPRNPKMLQSLNLSGREILSININKIENTLYLSCGSQGLMMVSIRSDGLRTIGTFLPKQGSVVTQVKMSRMNSLVYIVDAANGFYIVYWRQSRSPSIIGHYQYSGIHGGRALALSQNESVAYYADTDSDVKVLDISDRRNPKLMGFIQTVGAPSKLHVLEDDQKLAISGYGSFEIRCIGKPERADGPPSPPDFSFKDSKEEDDDHQTSKIIAIIMSTSILAVFLGVASIFGLVQLRKRRQEKFSVDVPMEQTRSTEN